MKKSLVCRHLGRFRNKLTTCTVSTQAFYTCRVDGNKMWCAIVKVRGSSTKSLLIWCVTIMSTVPTGRVLRPLPHCPGPVTLEVSETPVPAYRMSVGTLLSAVASRCTQTARRWRRILRHDTKSVKQVWKGYVIRAEQNVLQNELLRRHVEYRQYTDRTRVQQEDKKWKSTWKVWNNGNDRIYTDLWATFNL